ncbi:MAG TPA: PrsW family glutamic-type intramembrane protease, partial [Solirubrobacteraceae bacterium]|nr:PrsW family glutamic-type intramembrane protease [Solirubrobacteraceae bacterium]
MGTHDSLCPTCGREAASGTYCTQCGALLAPIAGERGAHFAAAPHEHLLTPAIVTTLFPHLPRRGHHSFRALLAIGAALMVALSLAGLFPVALIAAAVLVPLLAVLYLREVDLYEEEPLRVLALTLVWGALAGVAVGLLRDAVQSPSAVLAPQTQSSALLWNGVGLPLIGLVAALAGPLALLRYRNFNDTLDGATFGSASAVAFAGAYLLTESTTFLAAGLAPAGLVEPWLLRIVTLGLAVPVLDACALGAVAASFWLRYRGPARDRRLHRALATPPLALLAAGALLVGAALAQIGLGRWPALAVLVALDLAAVLWLRVAIQIGLVEERAEAEELPQSPCPNCRRVV